MPIVLWRYFNKVLLDFWTISIVKLGINNESSGPLNYNLKITKYPKIYFQIKMYNNNISAFMVHLGSSEIISYNTDVEGKRQEGGQSYYVEQNAKCIQDLVNIKETRNSNNKKKNNKRSKIRAIQLRSYFKNV